MAGRYPGWVQPVVEARGASLRGRVVELVVLAGALAGLVALPPRAVLLAVMAGGALGVSLLLRDRRFDRRRLWNARGARAGLGADGVAGGRVGAGLDGAGSRAGAARAVSVSARASCVLGGGDARLSAGLGVSAGAAVPGAVSPPLPDAVPGGAGADLGQRGPVRAGAPGDAQPARPAPVDPGWRPVRPDLRAVRLAAAGGGRARAAGLLDLHGRAGQLLLCRRSPAPPARGHRVGAGGRGTLRGTPSNRKRESRRGSCGRRC